MLRRLRMLDPVVFVVKEYKWRSELRAHFVLLTGCFGVSYHDHFLLKLLRQVVPLS